MLSQTTRNLPPGVTEAQIAPGPGQTDPQSDKEGTTGGTATGGNDDPGSGGVGDGGG